ncbi:type 1 glutamine amidotransferase domain-containing protein [Paucilactobacillus wasatchensis]|uniref:ThiJ/PfpI family protein n=1 Tax=Paucilactobacillus wasatchensis TaxID=1335616 RepID=A0A0D0YYP7_9LACO|nr:type 1 glutamine amidotransferase domain-containing protein [Paucilactobacillus wasatchensis]KIS04349.1 ThiJ/PfpI family protein [Paucilactobacillus wasatchensis]
MTTKQIAVLVTNGVEDIELTSPRQALVDAGYEPILIGTQAGELIYGKKGTTFKLDRGIDDTRPSEYQALFIPGGYSPDHLRADSRFVDFTSTFFDKQKPVFAICHGPQLFITGGLAHGKTMTAYKTVQPDLQYAGAEVKDQAVVDDGPLITSRNPDDLPAFNAAIVGYLQVVPVV